LGVVHYVALSAVAFLVALGVTPLVRVFARRHGILAYPGGRKIHANPVPELGGTGIFAGLFVAAGLQLAGEHFLGWKGFLTDRTTTPVNLFGIALGAAIIYVTGLIDDIFDISPGVKLLGQIAAATVVALCGVNIGFVSNPFSSVTISLDPVLSTLLTVFYLVSFANIINLVDGLDGLAAGISAIAAVSLLILAAGVNQLTAAILAAVIIGSCLGFLVFNFNPASIFMGDEGALLLGFLLGIISLMGVMKTTAAIALAVPLLIVAVPIFDTASAIIRRVAGRRPVQEADKGHIHHRLLGRGLNQRQTVLIIYLWSALLAAGGYAIRYTPTHIRAITLVVLLVITFSLSWFLGIFEAAHRDGDESPRRGRGKGRGR
jgi:UDP-GlcNAc:undecaprenyl-phosphate GlcNAc-1-phosphate transferase